MHIQTPLLTGSDCEGAGETFTLANAGPSRQPLSFPSPISQPPSFATALPSAAASSFPASSSIKHLRTDPFFPHPVNLTVSSQLHLECPTHALARTYTLSPCFRAEPSLTSRHLSEFYMLEAEVSFVHTLDQLLDIIEEGIKATLGRLLIDRGSRHERTRRDLAELEGRRERADLVKASSEPFPRLTYTNAVDLLMAEHEHRPFAHEPELGQPLNTEHEKWLAKYLGGPVFVTRYPKSLKPFYMLPSPDDTSTSECFDLLIPGLGELAGGSLREHRLSRLSEAISDAGLEQGAYEWYLDLRRYGSIPHGGWGMGWDRWVCWVTGVENVKDVVPFPRWRGHCKY